MEYKHNTQRVSGVVVPLSALRSPKSPGCGEYPDLEKFGELVSSWKVNLVQLLPVQDSGTQTSPYSALSAFALHPLYLRLESLPELAIGQKSVRVLSAPDRDRFREESASLVKRFCQAVTVPHEELYREKLRILAGMWEAGVAKWHVKALDSWIAAHPWINAYAAFMELKFRNEGRPWWQWTEYRDPRPEDIDQLWKTKNLVSRLRFHAWVQMRSDEQFKAAALSLESAGIELMGDIPILMNEDSAEVWSRRNLFRTELSAGAPPDMYSAGGQNWGFPVYDWEALEAENYAFWKERLVAANEYYSAFRIDHVLGFFRIWALSRHEHTGYLGRFVPSLPILQSELLSLGFSPERIRWLSRSHIRGARLSSLIGQELARDALAATTDRISDEDLYLFKPTIRGELDIETSGLDPVAVAALSGEWKDRCLFEFSPGEFAMTWRYSDSASWMSLSVDEKEMLKALSSRKAAESEALWEIEGRKILKELCDSVPMLACAEDLGSVPACVPRTLSALGILGLRVLRWAREWQKPASPYIPPTTYPEDTVACASVHDSTVVREWWTGEAEREILWSSFNDWLGGTDLPCPSNLGPAEVLRVLKTIASSGSRIAVYPVQDLLALSSRSAVSEPASERINVPGTTQSSNWGYRLPHYIETLLDDDELTESVRLLVDARQVQSTSS